MMLFEAASPDEAKAIVVDDPLVRNGCVSYQLYEWCIVDEIKTLTVSKHSVIAWKCYAVVRPGSMRSQRPNFVRTGR